MPYLCDDCIHKMVELTDGFDPGTVALIYCEKVKEVTPSAVKSCRYRQTEETRDMKDWDEPGVGTIIMESKSHE